MSIAMQSDIEEIRARWNVPNSGIDPAGDHSAWQAHDDLRMVFAYLDGVIANSVGLDEAFMDEVRMAHRSNVIEDKLTAERDAALARVRELEGRRCRTCHYWNELRAKPGEGDCWRRMNCIGCEFNMPMAADDSCWAWSKDERRQEWYEPATEANTPPPSTPSRRRVDSERAAPVGDGIGEKREDSCKEGC